MKLTYENYVAYSDDGRFNLYKIVMAKAEKDSEIRKKGEKYESESLVGYGYTFETLVKRIITDVVISNEDVTTLKEYIKAYREASKIIINEMDRKL